MSSDVITNFIVLTLGALLLTIPTEITATQTKPPATPPSELVEAKELSAIAVKLFNEENTSKR